MVNPPSHPFFVRGGFFIVSALALMRFPAYADESVSSLDDSANAETIEVTARRLNDTDNRPSALITVIESDDQGPGLTTTVGMLRQAPAVRIRENGGLGQLATVGLRGAAPNQTLILLDGIPLADTTGVGIDLSIVPTPFIERIEVLRGAASSQYGSGALGGVVNLVTRSVNQAASFRPNNRRLVRHLDRQHWSELYVRGSTVSRGRKRIDYSRGLSLP